ncbi:MAG: TolC family protein [Thermodesulfobacteriota bacterium]
MKKMQSIAKVLLPVGVLLLGAACSTMAPQYSRPPAPVASDWPSGDAYEKTKVENGMRAVSDLPWEDFFAHEPLRRVITQALENNRDLRVALLNIERSRALFQIRRAELFPEVDASAAALYQQVPADLSTSRRATKVEQYNVGLGVSAYELDLFGRVRSLKAQALEQYLAT